MIAGSERPDPLDSAIIARLEQDGRAPFRQIARELSVSEATVRARYRRLSESGRLRIVAFSDPAAGSGARFALVFLKVTPEHHDAVVKTLVGRTEVSYVSTILGARDVFAQVLVANDDELWRLLQNVIRPLAGVIDTKCVLEVNVHKLWFENAS